MNLLFPVIGTTTLLGAALVGGVFFAFSSFVMKALARVPSPEGIAVMQSINVVVVNPSFLGTFIGTALLSVVVIVLGFLNPSHPSTTFLMGGAAVYFVGTFLVTILGNVPLNDRLAAVTATDPAAVELWQHYLSRWTLLNHVRTAGALLAALLFCIGLMHSQGPT